MRLCKLIIIALIIHLAVGCTETGSQPHYTDNIVRAECFTPEKISVSSLTEISHIDQYNDYYKLNVLIHIQDKFDVKMKYPGVVRFELYEYRPHSTNNLAARLHDWQPIDVSDEQTNQDYWQDSLRAYIFELELNEKLEQNTKYVLTATMTTKNGLRMTAQQIIEYSNQ